MLRSFKLSIYIYIKFVIYIPTTSIIEKKIMNSGSLSLTCWQGNSMHTGCGSLKFLSDATIRLSDYKTRTNMERCSTFFSHWWLSRFMCMHSTQQVTDLHRTCFLNVRGTFIPTIDTRPSGQVFACVLTIAQQVKKSSSALEEALSIKQHRSCELWTLWHARAWTPQSKFIVPLEGRYASGYRRESSQIEATSFDGK